MSVIIKLQFISGIVKNFTRNSLIDRINLGWEDLYNNGVITIPAQFLE
jgi:hypothetical protein